MQRVTLQVPLSKILKDEAEKAAYEAGFSSLQEALRVFMKKFATKQVDITFGEPASILSSSSEQRYLKITQDFNRRKNIHTAKDVNELFKQLDEHSLS